MPSLNDGDVYVVGVGMTKFEKPGARQDWDYPQMVHEAVSRALDDAKLSYTDIQQAYVGYVYGDSTSGQRALYQLGMTAMPIVNVNNNCASGATALFLASQAVSGGAAHCVLAVGFDKMQPGALQAQYTDRCNPLDRHIELMCERHELQPAPVTAQMFGNAALEHFQLHQSTPLHLAKIAEKNHRHSANNPYSQHTRVYSLDEILSSRQVYGPLTRLQCCPTSDGAAAAVLVSGSWLRRYVSAEIRHRAVCMLDIQLTTDPASSLSQRSCIKMVGYDMSQLAVQRALANTKLSMQDVQVIELHDCFSANELITYEALGMCGEGGAAALVDAGDNTYGGKWVVNPSGGLLSKGHPLGATGLAQCAELCWQVRGEAGDRQVAGAVVALQHNIGLGGACVVALYQLLDEQHLYRVARDNTSLKDGSSLHSTSLINKLAQQLHQQRDQLTSQMVGRFEFRVLTSSQEMARWSLSVASDGVVLRRNCHVCPELVVTCSDLQLTSLLTGQLSCEQLFCRPRRDSVSYRGDSRLISVLSLLLNMTLSRSKL